MAGYRSVSMDILNLCATAENYSLFAKVFFSVNTSNGIIVMVVV